jgi:Tfp pilus assembly protein PilV
VIGQRGATVLEAVIAIAIAGLAAMGVAQVAMALHASAAISEREHQTAAARFVATLAAAPSVPDCPAAADVPLGRLTHRVCAGIVRQPSGARFAAVRTARVDGTDVLTWVEPAACRRHPPSLRELRAGISVRSGPPSHTHIVISRSPAAGPTPTVAGIWWQGVRLFTGAGAEGAALPLLRPATMGTGQLRVLWDRDLPPGQLYTFTITLQGGAEVKPWRLECSVDW